jgi:hypothetical protein
MGAALCCQGRRRQQAAGADSTLQAAVRLEARSCRVQSV